MKRDRTTNPLYTYEGYGYAEYKAENKKNREIQSATGKRPAWTAERAEYMARLYTDIHRNAPEEAERYDRILAEALKEYDGGEIRGRWNIAEKYREVAEQYQDYYLNLYEKTDAEVKTELIGRLNSYGEYLDKAGQIADTMGEVIARKYPDYEAKYNESGKLDEKALGIIRSVDFWAEIEHLALLMAGDDEKVARPESIEHFIDVFYKMEIENIQTQKDTLDALERIDGLKAGPDGDLIGYISNPNIFKWFKPRDKGEDSLKTYFVVKIYDTLAKRGRLKDRGAPETFKAEILGIIDDLNQNREATANLWETELSRVPEGPKTEAVAKKYPAQTTTQRVTGHGWGNLNTRKLAYTTDPSLEDFITTGGLIPFSREPPIYADYHIHIPKKRQLERMDYVLLGAIASLQAETYRDDYYKHKHDAPITVSENNLIAEVYGKSRNSRITPEEKADLAERMATLSTGRASLDVSEIPQSLDSLKDALGPEVKKITKLDYQILEYDGFTTMNNDGSETQWYIIKRYPATEWYDMILKRSSLVPSELRKAPKLTVGEENDDGTPQLRPEVVKRLNDLEKAGVNLWSNKGKGPKYISMRSSRDTAEVIDVISRLFAMRKGSASSREKGFFSVNLDDEIIAETWGAEKCDKSVRSRRRYKALTYIVYLMNRPELSGVYNFDLRNTPGSDWRVTIHIRKPAQIGEGKPPEKEPKDTHKKGSGRKVTPPS